MARKSKGPRPKGPIRRRDPEAKKKRREEREAAAADERDTAADGDDEDESEGEGEDQAGDEHADDGDDAGDAERDGDSDSARRDDDREDAAHADDDSHYLDGAEWARPLVELDKRWTWLETRLLFVTLITLIGLLCLWVAIHGMEDRESPAGLAWRAVVGLTALGFGSRYVTKRLGWPEKNRTYATIAAIVVGIFMAKSWRHAGNDYFHGLLDWLQQGSTIALFGGLAKGINTRLTMLVALIGASLACSAGSHINVDIIVRFVPKSLRHNANIASLCGAALVCACASWGFFDYLAVTSMHAAEDAPAGAKIAHVAGELGDDFFLFRKQLRLDVGALPYVLTGRRWNDPARMTGREWNAFLDDGFAERFGAEKISQWRQAASALDEPRKEPFVVNAGGTARGTLLEALNLVFPFGFLMLSLRLLLRALLVAARFVEPHMEGEGSGDAPAAGQSEEAA